MAMAQQVMPDVAATEPDESRSTAAVLPLRAASDRTESTELLHGWLGLSSMQRRALEALAKEIRIVSDDVEANVTGLSQHAADAGMASASAKPGVGPGCVSRRQSMPMCLRPSLSTK
jgi:hypothetical protein